MLLPRKSAKSEVEAFGGLIDSFDQVKSFAMDLSRLRPDQSHLWEKVAAQAEISKELMFKMAGSGVTHNKPLNS